MTAAEVKAALYGRHYASAAQMPGPWTCIEEWRNIDLLAFSAWRSVGDYARVGYEVKVSRSDLRNELLRPHKRAENVSWCNEFYLAVPAGLLTPAELAYREPAWNPEDFNRVPCPDSGRAQWTPAWHETITPCRKGKRSAPLVGPLAERERYFRPRVDYPCPTCAGRGYMEKSRVEREAPTVWVPRDVGLVVVDGRGCTVERRAPRRREIPAMDNRTLAQFVRYVSMRPDPRHAPRRDRHVEARLEVA